ncbi:hypothetical protein OSTOST_20021 [Ostertagia ostertagi]
MEQDDATEETIDGMRDTIKEEMNSSDEEYSNGQLFEDDGLAREVLTCFSGSLSQLLEEEANLMRIRQEEALMAVEVRKLEIEKLNLEIEWLRRRAESEGNSCSSFNAK